MSERARDLAEQFARESSAFLAFVSAIPEEEWVKPVGLEEPQPVGAVSRHVAGGYRTERRYFDAIAEGHPLSALTWPEIHAMNNANAREWRSLPKENVLAQLHHAAGETEEWIRGLDDAQLARRGEYIVGIEIRSVDRWIESVLIGHIQTHLRDIRQALAPEPDRVVPTS